MKNLNSNKSRKMNKSKRKIFKNKYMRQSSRRKRGKNRLKFRM